MTSRNSDDEILRRKNAEFKDQVQKYKAELVFMESKAEGNRRALRECEVTTKREILALEKEKQQLALKLRSFEEQKLDLEKQYEI